jgi:hypothetical protein
MILSTRLKIKSWGALSLLSGLLVITLVGCNRPEQEQKLSPEAQIRLDKLNSWDAEELDVAECPTSYPGRIPSGETNGWIHTHKRGLEDLGFYVHWNCETMVYEVTGREQAFLAFCDCKR